jgi:hypothetical protein
MDVRAAKDFLVEQTTQQASLERAPLSDSEKRMMYFAESSDAAEDPVKLNEESSRSVIRMNTKKRYRYCLHMRTSESRTAMRKQSLNETPPSTRFARETTICLFFGTGPRQA